MLVNGGVFGSRGQSLTWGALSFGELRVTVASATLFVSGLFERFLFTGCTPLASWILGNHRRL
jgi:hypothetical protein